MQGKFTRNALGVAAMALAAIAAPASAHAQAQLNVIGSAQFSSGPMGSAMLIDFLSGGQVSGPPAGTVSAVETINGEFTPEIGVGTPGIIQDLQFNGGSVVGEPIPNFLAIGGYTFSLEGVEEGGNFGPISLFSIGNSTTAAFSVFGTVTGPDFAEARNYQGIFSAQFSGQNATQVRNAIMSPNGTAPVSISGTFIVAEAQVVPEPATVVLLGTGVAALGLFGVRRRNAMQA